MKVRVIAKTAFIHGHITAQREGEELEMEEGLADDLAGFVERKPAEKMAAPAENKMAAEPENKADATAGDRPTKARKS